MSNKNNNQIDWKWHGLKAEMKDLTNALLTTDMSKSVNHVNQRNAAKRRKKQQKKNKRRARNLVIARECSKAFKDFLK